MSPAPEGDNYPTQWTKIPHYPGFETRQLEEDKYQIRSNTHYVTVNKEGYEIFISDDSKRKSWNGWMQENGVTSFRREDVA